MARRSGGHLRVLQFRKMLQWAVMVKSPMVAADSLQLVIKNKRCSWSRRQGYLANARIPSSRPRKVRGYI